MSIRVDLRSVHGWFIGEFIPDDANTVYIHELQTESELEKSFLDAISVYDCENTAGEDNA